MLKKEILLLAIVCLVSFTAGEGINKTDQEYILDKVNRLRDRGCYCGKKYMSPAGTVKWDNKLYQSALSHAKDMDKKRYFSHFSRDGKDIGERLDRHGYNWQVAGENLGEGQKNFVEVLNDWKKSKSHCMMLMNPKVEEMAVAKYGKYWVQHFGKKLPKNAIVSKEVR